MIVFAREFSDEFCKSIRVERLGKEHLLDVRPIASSIEHCLEKCELEWPKDGNRCSFERNQVAMTGGFVVNREVRKEQVDGRLIPPEPHLPVPADGFNARVV